MRTQLNRRPHAPSTNTPAPQRGATWPRRSLHLLCVTLLSVSCRDTGAEPTSSANAVARNECGPADGPTVAVYVFENGLPYSLSLPPSGAYTRLLIDGARASLAGTQATIPQGAFALRCLGGLAPCQEATGGSITVTSTTTDGDLDVQALDRWTPADSTVLQVRALWRPVTMLCG